MSKNGKARRRLSADEKLKILEEARQPNTTVAEVLRRHQLDATTSIAGRKTRGRRC